MKARFALATLVSVLLAACFLPKTNQSDGSSCSKDDECKSHRCFEGFCSGSECKLNDSSSCDDGWKCTHNEPGAVSEFFGSNGSETCKPTCGHCPGNMHCPKDAPAAAVCASGKAPLELSVAVENGIVGRSAKLTAKAANGARLVECNWEAGDGKPRETTTGPTLERAFADARKYTLRLSCDDDTGAHGFLESTFEIVCTPGGEACIEKTCCADEAMRCVGGTCRVPTPAVVEISGPTTVPIYEEATYTVAIAGGDGKAQNATWTFGDSIRTEQGLTVTRSIGDAGPVKVAVNVGTDINTRATKAITVNVCQVDGGRCGSGGVQCCAPLTCQGTSLPTCKP